MGLFNKKEKTVSEAKKTTKEIVLEICESIDTANGQLELIKKEYEEVNHYLQDAQLIAGLPPETEAELKEQAEHLIALKKDLSHLDKKKIGLTEFQFNLMEKYEGSIDKEVKRMKRDEDYKKVIEQDLRRLAGEKGILMHEEKKEKEKKRFLVKLGVVSGFIICFLLLMYFVFYLLFETFLDLPFLVTLGGGILLSFYIFIETDRNRKAILLNAAKINKLTALTNKVKIKYVNQTASLDYTRDKFAVDSAKELEERYKKYLIYKADEEKKRKANSHFGKIKERMRLILEEYHIHDSEVWTFQPQALVDKKEMVEIRHRLNERRGRLRERMQFNAKVIEESLEKLKAISEKYPEEKRVVYEMAEVYHLKL